MSEPTPILSTRRRICSYDDGNRYLKEMDNHFSEITEHGFNSVVLCVTEADLAQRTAISSSKPQIDKMFELANDHDLYPGIDPWKIGNIFGGEAVSGLGVQTLQRNGQIKEIGVADPHSPETIDMMTFFIDVAARAQARYVFFDEPNLGHFSEGAEIEFIDRWTEYAHHNGLATSVCLTAGKKLSTLAVKTAALTHVDEIATDPIYCGDTMLSNEPGTNHDSIKCYIGGSAQTVRKIADAAGKLATVWIQGHIIGPGHEHTIVRDGALEAAKYVDNVGFWAFRGGSYSNIASADPELVWKTAGETFNEMKASRCSRKIAPYYSSSEDR